MKSNIDLKISDLVAFTSPHGCQDITIQGDLTLPAGGVETTALADDAVTSAKIADSAVTWDKLAPCAIGTEHIKDNAVIGWHIQQYELTWEHFSYDLQNKILGEIADVQSVSHTQPYKRQMTLWRKK